MTLVNDSCHKRLRDIQEKFHMMEEMVSSMLHYKSKVEQLRQERFNLSVTYEENLQQYRLQVSKLERENMMLLNDYKKLQTQCYSSEHHENPQQLLEQIKVLEANNSYLQMENEQQRKEYEKYVDEIANQVVQAVLVQKGLKEECCQLQERVHDLEVQNKQLNLLFQHHFRFPNESTTKLPCLETYVTDGNEVNIEGRKLSLLDFASSAGMMFDKGAESLQSLCSHYSYEDGIPRINSPTPWLKEQLNEHSDRINAFSDRLSILSDHVLEAQLKAYSAEGLANTDLLSPSSSPVRQAFLNSCLKSYQYDSNAKIWKANQSCDNFKSKLYATVRPLNCHKTLPSITVTEANRAATTCLLHDHNSWKRNLVKANNYCSYKNHLVGIKPCRESCNRRQTDSILHSNYFAQMSPSDILENSLDGLPTPTDEPCVQPTFPVFRAESLKRKQSNTQEKLSSSIEKIPEATACQPSHQTLSKRFVEEPVPSNTIPTIARPSSLDIISPTDSPSQEDSQTSPLSPYLMNKNDSSMMNQSTDSENSPGMSASATFDHHNLVSSSYLDSTEDEKDLFDEKRSSLNSDYFSLDAQLSTSSYMNSLAPFHNDCQSQSNTEMLPLYSSNHSKSHHIHNRNSKMCQNNFEQEKDWNVLMPTLLNKRTLPEIYLACNEWQKNVAKSMKENDMSSELREMYSLSSDSSSESIKAEHSGNRDDGYSTMSSDMQPEMLEKFSDSAVLKRDRVNRNSMAEMNSNCCGPILSKLVEAERTSTDNCISSSTNSDNSVEGSTLTANNFHSSKLFSSKQLPEKEQHVPENSFQYFNNAKAHIEKKDDNNDNNVLVNMCTNTFPKCHYLSTKGNFSCASLPKQIGKSSYSAGNSTIHCQHSKLAHLNVPSRENTTLTKHIVTEQNLNVNNNSTVQVTQPDHRLTLSQSQIHPQHLKRSVSDSRLLITNTPKLRLDSIFSNNFNNSLSDCTISMSDLSSSQAAQSYQMLSGSLHRSPWQPLVLPTNEQNNILSSETSWSYKTSVFKKEHSHDNEHQDTNDDHNIKFKKVASVPSERNSVEKEKLQLPRRPQQSDVTQSAEEWLLQFSKEDIEKNLSYYKNRQKASRHHSTPWQQNTNSPNMLCWQTLQHRQPTHGVQAGRYMTLPVTNICQEQFETEDIDVNNLMSPKEIEEQKKFRQEFYSLCCVDSNRSLFSGSNNECDGENQTQTLKNLHSNNETCHEHCQSNLAEFDNVSLKIDNLSKTVKELQSSFSSLNSVECNSDIDSDIFNPSGHSSSVEGYHWVEDEFYLTPSSGDIIFTSCPSNESSASCDWMNEYADDSSEAFELKDSCEEDQQFLQKLCAVANLNVDSSKVHGGAEKLSTPEKDISDMLVMNPETRADMLDSMIDINTANESEDSSSDEQLSVPMFKHKKGRQKLVSRANAQTNFHNLFTRFGHQEKEAVSAFDFLDQFSTSSTNSETIMPDNNSEDLLTELSPVSHSSKSTDISPTAPNKFYDSKRSQLLSKKVWKQTDSSSRGSLARVTAIELLGNCSGDSLDSPEDAISASTLSLSDSCCES
ncbi:Hypothetical predicted protein [Octopus vulgaris]|uniref:Nck-associated protein 5 n=1 Tax=Octopus vulgaris TaxID=6645 RepID=A0AA36EYR5_OCTVU|nr:Hypothetical predicted protein [Octopus vulgaris]